MKECLREFFRVNRSQAILQGGVVEFLFIIELVHTLNDEFFFYLLKKTFSQNKFYK